MACSSAAAASASRCGTMYFSCKYRHTTVNSIDCKPLARMRVVSPRPNRPCGTEGDTERREKRVGFDGQAELECCPGWYGLDMAGR